MEKFDLNKVFEFYKPDQEAVAKVLFPHNIFPQAALRRALTGPTTIDADQIAALAEFLGVLVGDLYTIDTDWKGAFEHGHLTFKKGEYKAILNYKGSFLSVYKGKDRINTTELVSTTMTIESFINHINNIIKANNND